MHTSLAREAQISGRRASGVLIEINRVGALDYRRGDGDGLALGALTRESALEDDAEGRLCEPRLVLFGIGGRAMRAQEAEAMLAGERPAKALFAEAAAAAVGATDPYDDLHASASFRRHLAEVLSARVLALALARSGGEGNG